MSDAEDDHFLADDMAQQSTPLLEAEAAEPRDSRDPAFDQVIHSVESAIDQGIYPDMITQGSSGSYFCRNADREIVGVFKPKDEEPYGINNPKWGKWVQRNFCCCFYGRDCLLNNQGYLSEAGASLVDTYFSLNVVPKTKVVKLASPTFHYSALERARARTVASASNRFPETLGKRLRQGLAPKTGSMQMFVKGFQDAQVVLKRIKLDELQPATRKSLQSQFEAMVCLDYITRNTDRGNNNWLIRYVEPGEDGKGESVKIAAIDNGLSFPFKHPDNWRAYPYYWAWLPMARLPFSRETAEKLLPKLEDDDAIERLVDQLYILFSQDPGFSRSKFEHQMAVMRGQILNLRKALREEMSPHDLVQLPTAKLLVQRRDTPGHRIRRYRQIISKRVPFFKWC